MRNAKCEMRNAKREVGIVKRETQNTHCELRNTKREMGKMEMKKIEMDYKKFFGYQYLISVDSFFPISFSDI